jgi:hypothetical protein
MSTPPPTLEDEEGWDSALDAKGSQAVTATSSVPAPKAEARAAGTKSEAPKPQPLPSDRSAATSQSGLPARGRADADEGQERAPGGSRVALLVIAAALVGGAWFFLRSGNEPRIEPSPDQPAAAHEPAKPEVTPPEPATQQPAPAPSVEVARVPPANAAPAASAEAASAPSAAASNTAAKAAVEPTASPTDLVVVTVTTIPPDARFYYKGKGVGRSPFRVELKPGERRSFEIGRPGYHARKVVVDGKKKEMVVAMKPEG